MRVFHCDHCGRSIFFENTSCENCGHKLAYLPDLKLVGSLDPVRESERRDGTIQLWTCPSPRARGRTYRLCRNFVEYNVCNWAVPSGDPNPLCKSCRLTTIIPDLSQPQNQRAWARLETAKRRVIYSLMEHRLPIRSKREDATGLEFHFLGDSPGGPAVLTGHNDGVITVNIAEADDVERERRRVHLREPYRTLLGHFRHEIGHYYWDRLVKNSQILNDFRRQFGDERNDYARALRDYYDHGPVANWQASFISEYASVHPWEDWAETYAHYLHMTDALETAAVCGLQLHPDRPDEPKMEKQPRKTAHQQEFDEIVGNWFPLTYVLNALNRGMGLPDAYPFVLSQAAIEKLRFVHHTICCRDAKAGSRKALKLTKAARVGVK